MKNKILLILLLSLAFILRFYKLGEIPPALHVDEAYMTQAALSLIDRSENPLDSYYSITRIGNWMTAVFLSIFGFSYEVVRLSSVVYGMVAILMLYLFCKEEFNKQVAVLASFIASVSHVFLAYSRMNLPNMQVPALFMALLYSLNKAIHHNSLKWTITAGVIAGISMYSYTGAKLIPLLGVVYLIFHIRSVSARLWMSYFFFFIFTTIPLFSLISGIDNYFVREYEVSLMNEEVYPATPTTYLSYSIINFFAFIDYPDKSVQYANGPILDFISVTFFLFTLGNYFYRLATGKKYQYKKSISLLLSCFLIIIASVSLTDAPPQSQRLLISLPIVFIFIALGIEKLQHLVLEASTGTAARITTMIVLSVLATSHIYTLFGNYRKQLQNPYTWIEPATSIAEYNQNHQEKTNYLMETENLTVDFSTLVLLSRDVKPLKPYSDDLVLDENSTLIVPLFESYTRMKEEPVNRDKIVQLQKEGYGISYSEDTKCPKCFSGPLFGVVSKQ